MKSWNCLSLEGESANEASAGSRQLEVLDGEWEVVIVRVEDEETVVDVLLEALGLVASRDQWARFTSSIGIAFFDAGVLIELDSVGLDLVDNDAPLAIDVNSTKRLDVGGRAWAQVGLFFQLGQSVDRVGCVGCYVLVQGQNGFVVLVKSVDNIVRWILRVLQTPGLGGVLGAGRDLRLVGFVVLVRGVLRNSFVGCRFVGHNSHNTESQTNL